MNSSFGDWQVIGLDFLSRLQVEVLYSESCNNIRLFWLGKLCMKSEMEVDLLPTELNSWDVLLQQCSRMLCLIVCSAWLWTMWSVDCSWTTYSSWCSKTHAKICHYPIAYNWQHHSLNYPHIANWRLPTPLLFLLWQSQVTQLWRYKILG
jgi:hypothetical protein